MGDYHDEDEMGSERALGETRGEWDDNGRRALFFGTSLCLPLSLRVSVCHALFRSF